MSIYSKKTGVSRWISRTSLGLDILGYRGSDIPKEYLIRITDRRPKKYTDAQGVSQMITIRAPLQEKLSTRTEATWTALAASSYAQSLFGSVVQYFVGRTLVSQYASRRIWSGTTPLDFTLNLKFEAIDNVDMEVFFPIVELQRMSLPFSGSGSFLAKAFLSPPGPDPFRGFRWGDWRDELPKELEARPDEYEHITVHIGTMMEIRDVVVKDITIQQSPKFNKSGRPVEAIATVHFQTFEIITKESLDEIYKTSPAGELLEGKSLKDQSPPGPAGIMSSSTFGISGPTLKR